MFAILSILAPAVPNFDNHDHLNNLIQSGNDPCSHFRVMVTDTQSDIYVLKDCQFSAFVNLQTTKHFQYGISYRKPALLSRWRWCDEST